MDDDDRGLTERAKELKRWNKPYVYQEFPKALYRGTTTTAGRVELIQPPRVVTSEREEQDALAAGWCVNPQTALDAETRRQEAIAAARQEQKTRELEEALHRVLDEREERRKSELLREQAVDHGAELTLHDEHRAQYALRFDAWRKRALAAFSRPTVLGGRSVGEILRNDQPTAEEDETAFRRLDAMYELAELCRDFVIGELEAVAFLEQRQRVTIDEILRRAAARAPAYLAAVVEDRWRVELRAIDGGRRGEYARSWDARRVEESLEDASWVASVWWVIVEDPVPDYLEQWRKWLKSALERDDVSAKFADVKAWGQRRDLTPAAAIELLRKQLRRAETASFSQQLTALRKEARWTVEELADQVDLTTDAVQDHLSGKSQPRLKNLREYEAKFTKHLKRSIKFDA